MGIILVIEVLRVKKCIVFICICCMFIVARSFISYSAISCSQEDRSRTETDFKNNDIDDYMKNFDYTEIQEVIDDADVEDFNFEKEVNNTLESGDIEYGKWFDNIKNKFIFQLKSKKSMIVKIIFLILFSAIFTSFTQAIDNSYISETGFLIVYMILMTTIFPIFKQIYNIGLSAITQIKNLIEVLVPTYTVASFIGTGINTATAFSQITMLIVVIIEKVFIKIMLPLINVYLVVLITDNISKTRCLYRLAELIMSLIKWGNKAALGGITAIATIKKLIAPSIDITSKKMIGSGIKFIPYVGNGVESVKETIISAGYMIKNAMGGVSIITIILLCLVPVVNLISYIVVYELITVVAEPIADSRMVNAIKGIANGGKLLLEVLVTSAILFIISIALLAS